MPSSPTTRWKRNPASLRSARGRARVLGVALAGAALLIAPGCDVTEDSDLERGRALFQQKCGTCHALAQAGTAATLGPDLDASFAQARADGMDNDTVEGVVQSQIANPRTVRKGAPNYDQVFMPQDLVTGQDAEDVATYVASVAGVPGAKPPELPPDQFFTENCGSCHTLAEAGTSGTVGPNLDDVLAGQDAAQVAESIRTPEAKISSGFPNQMPAFTEAALPEDDLNKLIDYLLKAVGGK